MRRQPSQLEDDDDTTEANKDDLPDAEGLTLVCQGTVIRTSYEGEELSRESFECKVSLPCEGKGLKAAICESCKVSVDDFHDVGLEIADKPIVNKGNISVKRAPDGLKVFYEYFQGCCGNIAPLEFVQCGETELQIPVVVTTREKAAAMSAATKVYVSLTVSKNDIRSDFQFSESFQVEVLKVDAEGQKFQLSGYSGGKTNRNPETSGPECKGAVETLIDAISSGKTSKVGTCEVSDKLITLHGARLNGGKLEDVVHEVSATGFVVWDECHYERAPKRWTKVWLDLGDLAAAESGGAAKQPWLLYKDVSPYCEAMAVAKSQVDMFSTEPAWAGAPPTEI